MLFCHSLLVARARIGARRREEREQGEHGINAGRPVSRDESYYLACINAAS